MSDTKALAHEIKADIVRVAQELGRPPSRDEYLKNSKFSQRKVVEVFGSYTVAMTATGLKYTAGTEKIDKQEIRKQVFEKLQEEVAQRKIVQPPKIVANGLIISDRHMPYHHVDCVEFLIALNRKYKFDAVADVGDGEDFHALSFHSHDPDLPNPGHELMAVIQANKPLYAEFPVMEIAESNHGSMVYRKGLHHGFPRHVLKSYRDVLEAPIGWTWKPEIVWQLPNGQKVLICHSYGSNVLQVSKKRGMSVVQGHHHSKASIEFWSPHKGSMHFAAQTGCLVDDDSLALSYNKNIVERPLLFCIRVTDSLPHLLPMILDINGRWNGKVY